MKTLYEHQGDAFSSVKTVIKAGKGRATGRIVIPTGGGKTWIEAAITEHRMDGKEHRVFLVLSPRIILSNQLSKDFRDFINPKEYVAVAFHSGKHEPDYTKVRWHEQSTTNEQKVYEEIARSQRMGKDLVIFSTYHSCHRLKQIDFDMVIADESQYCVAEEFHNSIVSLTSKIKLFFTATEKYTASVIGRGLNNTSVYGERIFEISPAELIGRGIIVPPRLHIMYSHVENRVDVRGKEREDIDQKTIVSKVIELASEQHKLTLPELGFSKILFALNGTNDVKTIRDNIETIKQHLPNHKIFTITSREKEHIDGVKCSGRQQFLKEIKKDGESCLIFHYDILSEGIDVDGITGVCILRNMGLAKMLQTIGRAVRIYKPDPSKKRQAWISVPVIDGDEDGKEIVGQYVRGIRDAGYPINIEDVMVTNWKSLHAKDQNQIEDAYHNETDNKSPWWLEDVFHEVEEERFFDDINRLAVDKQAKQFSLFLDLFSFDDDMNDTTEQTFDDFLEMF